MTGVAIRVDSLSKQYHLGAVHRHTDMLREHLLHGLRSWLGPRRERDDRTIWALRDVSFTVAPGEIFGVIGANGAGKSTLLKILSRIVEPTAGRVEVYGRMSSLLEVGTGFHPELTGRENVYLNGAILGMSKAEISRKFDEIVAFAELSKFIDTPVKRYSSGMYVRLAFSVAAHLEPDILLLDEVLAVGDAAFQRKCLGKIQDVARSERTILFVSHNLSAIQQLCTRSLVLASGRVTFLGDTTEALNRYLGAGSGANAFTADPAGRTRYIATARLVRDPVATPCAAVEQGEDLVIELGVVNDGVPFDMALGMGLLTRDMVRVVGQNTIGVGEPIRCQTGRSTVRLTVPKLPLMEGTYVVSLALHKWHSGAVIDHAPCCLSFDVLAPRTAAPRATRSGLIAWDCDWQLVDGP
jgi:lipopolysaccharide transport system ATP-binding protein